MQSESINMYVDKSPNSALRTYYIFLEFGPPRENFYYAFYYRQIPSQLDFTCIVNYVISRVSIHALDFTIEVPRYGALKITSYRASQTFMEALINGAITSCMPDDAPIPGYLFDIL
jgi:hypothetical protein